MNTPLTDANAFATEYALVKEGTELVLADFARQLERELAAEQEKVRELREALEEINKEVGYSACADNWPKLHNVGIIARAILEKTK
jgi:hypothetical protein